MAGTDSKKNPQWSPEGPKIILIEPQMGENIGAAARAMWNFGLRDMRLVAPRDGWPNERAIATASGAHVVLDEARVLPGTAEAVADLHYIYATTARPREMIKTVMTPERAVRHMRALIAGGNKVGVLFGRERTGLENDDVARANAIVTVPVNPAFASLNLGQCVLLMAYEWRRQTSEVQSESYDVGRTELATGAEREMMLTHLEDELDDSGYFHPEDKGPAMRAALRNIFARTPLTEQDVRTMRGVIRSLSHRRRRGRSS